MSTIISVIGGLGIFLLGMLTLTDNLHKLAGEQLRAALMRFTRTPVTGAITGALATALVQSSSATTVAAVGFVGAGLMSFSNALGIIFGANIGTTITGWMVALLGFKLSLGLIVLPLIFVGVLIRFFFSGRWSYVGMAIAGFGLIFVGIDTMKDAMVQMQDILDFSSLPSGTMLAKLQLLLLGLVFTVITQSSSAGVAVTLTALYSGIIQFEQAAALVIGMDVGTTMTSALASIGGTTDAKRTGFSHVIYNVLTAVLALLLIDPYISAWLYFGHESLTGHGEVALVGFHTLFNTLGVIFILPFAKPFARFMEWMFPARTYFGDRLGSEMLVSPDLALKAGFNAMLEVWETLLSELAGLLSKHGTQFHQGELRQLEQELDEMQNFLSKIHPSQKKNTEWPRLLHLIHALDHMQRLFDRLDEDAVKARQLDEDGPLNTLRQEMLNVYTELQLLNNQRAWEKSKLLSGQTSARIKKRVKELRVDIMQRIAMGELDAESGELQLDAIRWANRVADHVASITYHLRQAVLATGE